MLYILLLTVNRKNIIVKQYYWNIPENIMLNILAIFIMEIFTLNKLKDYLKGR